MTRKGRIPRVRSGGLGHATRGMRVVLASRIYWPESAAASFRLTAVVDALVDSGAEVEVLTSRPGSATGAVAESAGGPRVRRWPVLRDKAGYVRGYLPYLSFDLPLVLRLLATRRPDVVLIEPPPTTGAVVRVITSARSALAGRRIPYVYYAADVWSDASASTGAPAPVVVALRVLERFALAGAQDVIAVAEGVAQRVRELGARTVHVVPNGIDTAVFTPAAPTAEPVAIRGLPESPFLVYAGTASEWQGAEVFAEAMRQVVLEVPGARLVFLGQGSSWPALQRVARELPAGTMELLPLVSPHAAAAWLRAAAGALVSVKPGLGYDFAYPTKVLAALACGTPVVYAGPGPAAYDLIEHDLGEAVPYAVEHVAAAMIRVLRAKPDAAAGRRRVGWVVANRSLTRTGREAAAVILFGPVRAQSSEGTA